MVNQTLSAFVIPELRACIYDEKGSIVLSLYELERIPCLDDFGNTCTSSILIMFLDCVLWSVSFGILILMF